MTIGIYLLSFNNDSKVYIGQSSNIERRCTTHKRELRLNKHENYRLQNAYNLYGEPTHRILEITSLENLTDREIYYINKFNSIKNGYNITYPYYRKSDNFYLNNKWSKLEILKAFRYSYLAKYAKISYKDIAQKLKVSIYLINNIRSEKNHLWLQKDYPFQYAKMLSLRNSEARNNKITGLVYKVFSPTKEIHEFTSISKFAKLHNLDRGNLNRLINNRCFSCKGWTKA